jgi:hypothetical protein
MRTVLAPYPAGPTGKDATVITASSGNVAAGTATATLTAGGANFLTYISGFEFTGAGATGASVVALTVTGTVGGTLTYNVAVPAGVSTGVSLIVEFNPPIPANALNTNIVVSIPTLGAGNTNSAVVAHGYNLPQSS